MLEALGEENFAGPLLAVTGPEWWKMMEGRLAARVDLVVDAAGVGSSATVEKVKSEKAGTVLAAGHGRIIEIARRAALASGADLVVVPTAIDGESAVRRDVIERDKGAPKIIGEKETDLLIVDSGLIWGEHEALTRTGVGELLAISPTVEDCRIANLAGLKGLTENVAERAVDLVGELFDWADEIGELTESGIRRLVELLIAREELARKVGSRRPIEGSAHFFADLAELKLGVSPRRGALICMGVILMMELQRKSSRPAKQFLHWLRVPWKPEDLGLTADQIGEVISALPGYVRDNKLPYTVIDDAALDEATIKRIINAMLSPLLKSSFQTRDD